MEKEIGVFIEHQDGEVQEASLEVLVEASRLAGKSKARVAAVLLGKGVSELQGSLPSYGADKIYVVEHSLLEVYSTDGYTTVLADIVQKCQISVFLLAGTVLGRDLAPRLAARLNAGLVMDCTVLNISDRGVLEMTRPIYGGRVYATYSCPEAASQIATIRPGVLGIGSPKKGRTAEAYTMACELQAEDIRTKILGFSRVDRKELDIAEAEVLLAIGRGVEADRNLAAVDKIAALMDASLSGSRAAVDEGWITFERQIGQTGKSVCPKFILCCGISGAQQFTMGIRDAKFIVALNKDRHAPIFKVADISVVGDMHEITPLLIERLEKILGSQTSESHGP